MRFPLLSSLLRAVLLLVAVTTAARAGTWSTTAWSGDASTYIVTGQTVWAYHFGSANPATVNGVSVPGIVGPTHASAEFDLTGAGAVFNGFTNNLTALGGTGSAVMAADFIYSGNPANITVKGLVAGQTYTVSFYGVDFGNDTRLNRFTNVSDGDFRDVDEHEFGSANGIRVDYTFLATATTRAFSIAIANPFNNSWHLFGLALRQEAAPTTVTNVQDAGTGSLRWALANAAAIAGADTVTFDASLSGGNINTLSELTIADAGGATIDASALAAPLTIFAAGPAHRLITHTAGSLTLRRLRLGNGSAGAAAGGMPNVGGAVRSSGAAFEAFDCSFQGNIARFTGGALSLATSGASTIEGCTFASNVTSEDAGAGGAAAAVDNGAALAVRKSTFHSNVTAAGATGPSAGAILNSGSLALEHCTLADNTSGGTGARGALLLSGGGVTITNSIIANNATADVNNATGSAANLTYAGANLVLTQANALFTGPAPLTAAPLLGDFGPNGGPTDTRTPQFGSPAIDAATTIAGHSTDQRGVTRPFDGDGNGTASPDLGAVEARFPIVSNGNDSGVGSLRQAMADAATFAGPDTIVFRSASFPTGGTVNLTASLTIPAAGDDVGITLATAVTGGNVDVAVNAGTFSWGEGSTWTGGGRVLLGATSGSAPATVEIADGNGATTLAAAITVRAGSSGLKTLRDANTNVVLPNTFAGAITLLAPVSIEESAAGKLVVSGDVDFDAQTLTVEGAAAGTIDVSGRLFRSGATGKAQMIKNGSVGLNFLGSGDNTRLAVTVNTGLIVLGKTTSASVHAVGGGLTAADGAALVVAGGGSVLANSGDQIADTASVTVDGTLNFGDDETIDALDGTGIVQPVFGNRLLTVGATNGSGSFGGSLRFGLSLTKAGNGTQTLSGTSSATGAIIVSGGVLNVTGSVATSSGIEVQNAGTLGGTGTVPALVLQSGSVFAPGNANVAGSIGTFGVSGSATWNGGSSARFHLSATDSSSDAIAATGPLLKGTAGAYAFDFLGTGIAGQAYTLATFASSTFSAADFSYTGLASGLVGYFTRNATSLTFTVTAFSTVVANNADSGPGSLRQLIDDAAHSPGADTITFPPGFTGPLMLTSGEIVVADTTGGVTIDATSLPGGLSLSGGGTSRIFTVSSSNSLTLLGLTLTGGNGSGGAIRNNTNGSLTLTRCTLSGNTAVGDGGAIHNSGTATLTQCTLSNNSATASGGALYNSGTATVTQCTLSGNSANSSGGAISNASGTLTLTNSIVAGNSGPSGADLGNSATLTPTGVNFIGNTAGSGLSAGPAILTGNALLVPLADNGGPTPTIALRPGSPALDAATVLGGLTTDQRGFPRHRDGNPIAGALPDIGAYEAQVAPVSGVGFNFVGGGVGGPGGTMAASDVAGVPVFAQGNWNNLTGNIDGPAHDGTYAANGPVPIVNASAAAFAPNLRVWWASQNLWNISPAVQSTPDRRLMNGYLDTNVAGSGATATDLYALPLLQSFLAVAGLPVPPGGYKVIVYTDGDATGRIGEFWLTTNRNANPASVATESDLTPHLFVQDNTNFFDTYTRVPSTSTSNLGAGTPGGNYLVFEGLTEPGFIVHADETVVSAPLNAVQIVPNEIIVVTTAVDELDANGTLGAGISLREALRDAPDGAGILFDSTLNGATIALDPAKGEIVLAKEVTIDASNLSGGITVDGGTGPNRIFTVSSGKTASLVGLTLTGGNGTGALASGDGGAILNRGYLRLTGCTLSANTATGTGGALANEGTALLTRSTVAGNTASGSGGGISNTGAAAVVTLTHCTVSTNQAPTGTGGGLSNVDGTATLAFSIVAGNTAASAANVSGAFAQTGASLTAGDPLLAALASNGGPTQTMALLAGSPALNAAVGSLATSDQRGSPIVGVPDIGAYEASAAATTSYAAWSVQVAGSNLPATDDTERDGAINALEYALRRDPQVSDTPLSPTLVKLGAGRQFAFRYQATAGDLRYIVERNPDLANAAGWTEIYRLDTSTGIITEDPSITGDENDTTQVITLLDPATGSRLFWRLRIELLP